MSGEPPLPGVAGHEPVGRAAVCAAGDNYLHFRDPDRLQQDRGGRHLKLLPDGCRVRGVLADAAGRGLRIHRAVHRCVQVIGFLTGKYKFKLIKNMLKIIFINE